MKVLVIVGIIFLLQVNGSIIQFYYWTLTSYKIIPQNVKAKVKFTCPDSSPEPCTDTVNTKPGQIIDSNGCLVWTCVPIQPYCCEREFSEIKECPEDTEPFQTLDLKKNCKIWTCAPKQPYCCGLVAQKKCDENTYSVEVYDPKTGCLVWSCAPCPEFNEEEGMNMCCLIGFPCKKLSSIGCPMWTCCSNEIFPEYLDVLASQ